MGDRSPMLPRVVLNSWACDPPLSASQQWDREGGHHMPLDLNFLGGFCLRPTTKAAEVSWALFPPTHNCEREVCVGAGVFQFGPYKVQMAGWLSQWALVLYLLTFPSYLSYTSWHGLSNLDSDFGLINLLSVLTLQYKGEKSQSNCEIFFFFL